MQKPSQSLIYGFCLLTLWFGLMVLPARSQRTQTSNSVVEWLQFQIPVTVQANFIEKDRRIWTSFLSKQKGFIRKEVLTNLAKPEDLTLLIYWQTLADWEKIPKNRLDEVQTRFEQELGMHYPIIESRGYHLHNSAQTTSTLKSSLNR
jgi:uncharacterized protein (TIGR03792 family)